mmetsp:Transcript_6032/g.7363  ORF Transcript_6032/g.7363 Transcript_6032/m.7363 type:complete len:102 (-) Transcript_6032:4429-4734(-)
MADFDEDDLADYDNYSGEEEFNEDNLDDQEYDKLYASLPKLKEGIKDYNDEILEIDLKEALYFNYYEIEEAIKELKSRYPKKKTKSMYIFNFVCQVSCHFE